MIAGASIVQPASELPIFVGRPNRLVYFGTPAMAVAPLRCLVAAGFTVACVVTGVDKRRGRGAELSPTPVGSAAHQLQIPVVHTVAESLAFGADLGVVVAYGKLIPATVLRTLPMINVHFSLLPRWRGAAPVERALLSGDATTGVCIMALAEGLDIGPIYAVQEIMIDAQATGDSLRADLVELGSRMLVDGLMAGLPNPSPQIGHHTYAAKITPDDLRLDLTRAASELDRVIRLGGAYTTWRSKRLRIHEASVTNDSGSSGSINNDFGSPGSMSGDVMVCGEGGLRLIVVQPEGKPKMNAADWLRGIRFEQTERLGS